MPSLDIAPTDLTADQETIVRNRLAEAGIAAPHISAYLLHVRKLMNLHFIPLNDGVNLHLLLLNEEALDVLVSKAIANPPETT